MTEDFNVSKHGSGIREDEITIDRLTDIIEGWAGARSRLHTLRLNDLNDGAVHAAIRTIRSIEKDHGAACAVFITGRIAFRNSA